MTNETNYLIKKLKCFFFGHPYCEKYYVFEVGVGHICKRCGSVWILRITPTHIPKDLICKIDTFRD